MNSTGKQRSALDVEGYEFDWLGCDTHGHVAMFSTAGGSYAPAEFLLDADAHKSAIEHILLLPATTEARFFPEVGDGCVNDWQLIAERGVYAYDGDYCGGPYRLVAAPVRAIEADALAPEVAKVASEIACPWPFEGQAVVTEAMLRAREPPPCA